jgi:methyl-accepting chemotaxis protein
MDTVHPYPKGFRVKLKSLTPEKDGTQGQPRKKSLKRKLTIAFLILSLVPVALVGWISFNKSEAALHDQAGDAVQASSEQVLDKLDRNLFERYGDVQAFASNPKSLGDPAEVTDAINTYTSIYGIYDLMIVTDLDGVVIATNTIDGGGSPIDTSPLIGRSVAGEDWFVALSSAGAAWDSAETFYTDLAVDPWVAEMYSSEGLTLDYNAPIYDADGNIVRYWSNRASWDRIVVDIVDSEIASLESKGVTADIGVFTATGELLNGAQFTDETPEVAVQAAAAGEAGFTGDNGEIIGYSQAQGAYNFEGYGWIATVGQPSEQALAPASALKNTIILSLVLIAGVVIGIALWLTNSVIKPIRNIQEGAEKLAEGDLSVKFDVSTRDEINEVADSLQQAVDNMSATADALQSISTGELDIEITSRGERDVVAQSAQRLLEATIKHEAAREENVQLSEAAQEAAAAAEEATAIAEDASTKAQQIVAEQEQAKSELELLLHKIAENAASLSEETNTLTGASAQLSSSSDKTSGYAQEVFESGSFVDEATQAVAASILEMSTSIGEIANTAEEAARMAEDALGRGSETAKIIETLNGAAANIGSIVDVIQEIAKQTNLLALNAAIEAARAGEAGRGFAVVATEVKALAEQTAGSTSEIVEMVNEVQAGCQKADVANQAVVETVKALTETSSVIAAAVEEQTATNEEVTNRIDDVAKSMADISKASAEMADLAKGSQDASTDTHGSAENIATLANQLEDLVSESN